MTGHARSLPHLGFDPAPGDVGLTWHLARRHEQVAQEARQVLAAIGKLDLQALQGQAADAMRALQATFPPALRDTASAAETLHAATASWGHQLSGFQAEADALERQAAAATAHQQALQAKQAAMPPGSAVLRPDMESASAAVSGIHRQAEDLHQRYLAAAAKTAADVGGHSGLWDRTEPVRTVLEAVLAPLDIIVADHWVSALEKIAGVPSEWEKEVSEQLDGIEAAMRAGRSQVQELQAAAQFLERTGGKLDAWYGFAPGWLKTAAGGIAGVRGLSCTLSGAGLLADAGTLVSPAGQGRDGLGGPRRGGSQRRPDHRRPGGGRPSRVGEVALAATGIYLAGDFLYHHWTPFHDVAHEVGHATVKVADGIGHTARSVWHSVTSTIGSWF